MNASFLLRASLLMAAIPAATLETMALENLTVLIMDRDGHQQSGGNLLFRHRREAVHG